MPMKSPMDLLTLELKEIHSAERQLSRALPRIARNASSERLREMLERRREQGSQLIEAIDEALEEIGTTRARKKNVAIEGLIEDVNQHADEIQDERMLQAAVLASVQKIEHYCIAAWGTAKSLGKLLGQQKVVEAMERALDEGKQFDQEMTQLAEEEINVAMLSEEEAGEEEEEEEETEEQEEEAGEGQEEQTGAKTSSRKKQSGGGRRKSAA
jgi:ferritin-like metal-binding protein YciE